MRSGKFKSTDLGLTWNKEDDGAGGPPGAGTAVWDVGWTNCPHTRGRALKSVAKTLSAKGEYWVTPQFVWRYATSPLKYENAFTTQASGGWITKSIDNAVPTAFMSYGTTPGRYFAGYYDVGIWRTTDDGASWQNVNPAAMPSWDGFGGSVTGITADGVVTCATMAQSSKADSASRYRHGLWRSTDTGASWLLYRGGTPGLPYPGFMYGLSRDPGNGDLWLTEDGQVYKSTDQGVSWTEQTGGSLPADGIYVTQAKNGVVLVGGTHGLHRWAPPSGPWTEVHANFNFNDSNPSRTGTNLHKVKWRGIQQILFDPLVASRVWVVSYVEHGFSSATLRKGIWKSDDNGSIFTAVMDSALRRGIAIDSTGSRLHITSGAASTAGTVDAAEMTAAVGKQTCRGDVNHNFALANCTVDTEHADYRYPFGGPIHISECGKIFVGVPGYGFMRQYIPCGSGGGGCGEPPCEIETEGITPGGDLATKFTVAEAQAADPKRFKLYDIAGRRVQEIRPGIYFDGITRRRIVIVHK